MTNINLKPVTCAVVLGILLEAGCGGTINLTKREGSAGSDSTLAGGTDSLFSGGAGSITTAGTTNSGASGRGADASPGSVGGTGNRGGAGNLAGGSNLLGGASRNACDKDSDPCATDAAITCVVRNTDSKNCGTCGNACSSGEVCFAGVCASPPPACGTDSMLAVGPPLASGTLPQSLAIGDWNGDGMTDLAAANSKDGTLSVFLGCGSGTFAPRADYVVTTTSAAPNTS